MNDRIITSSPRRIAIKPRQKSGKKSLKKKETLQTVADIQNNDEDYIQELEKKLEELKQNAAKEKKKLKFPVKRKKIQNYQIERKKNEKDLLEEIRKKPYEELTSEDIDKLDFDEVNQRVKKAQKDAEMSK